MQRCGTKQNPRTQALTFIPSQHKILALWMRSNCRSPCATVTGASAQFEAARFWTARQFDVASYLNFATRSPIASHRREDREWLRDVCSSLKHQ